MRYLPLSADDRSDLLARIGVDHIDKLFTDIPQDKLLDRVLPLPLAKSELDVERILSKMAARNKTASTMPFFCWRRRL